MCKLFVCVCVLVCVCVVCKPRPKDGRVVERRRMKELWLLLMCHRRVFRQNVQALGCKVCNIGTIQRRLAWPLRKDDTHTSRSVVKFFWFAAQISCRQVPSGPPALPPGVAACSCVLSLPHHDIETPVRFHSIPLRPSRVYKTWLNFYFLP